MKTNTELNSSRTAVPNPFERPMLSVPEAGLLLGLGRDGSYEAVRRGEIPTIKLGRQLRVPTAKLLEKLGIDPNAFAKVS